MSPMRNRNMTKETLTHTSNCSISSYTAWAISALKLSGALPFARAAGYFFWPSCAPSRRKNKKPQQKHITSLASCCAPVWKNKSFATFPTFAPKYKNLDTFFAMGHFFRRPFKVVLGPLGAPLTSHKSSHMGLFKIRAHRLASQIPRCEFKTSWCAWTTHLNN